MLILNFTHPFTTDQQSELAQLILPATIKEIRNIPVHINQNEPLEPQIETIIASTNLTNEEWQTRPYLINPPGYAPVAFMLLASIHGISGHFPSFIRLRPKQDAVVTTFEIAEIINLQILRDRARISRFN